MFEWLLDSRRGLMGFFITQLGISDHYPSFFGGIPGTLFTLVGVHVWKTFPLLAIMFLVALQYLPQETVQAARIDGATMLRRFRYVVLPHLRPTIIAGLIIGGMALTGSLVLPGMGTHGTAVIAIFGLLIAPVLFFISRSSATACSAIPRAPT